MAAARSAVQFMEGMNKSKGKGSAPMKLTVEDKDVIVTVKVVGKSKPGLFSLFKKKKKNKKEKENNTEENKTTYEVYEDPYSLRIAPQEEIGIDWNSGKYTTLKVKPEPPARQQPLPAVRQSDPYYQNQNRQSLVSHINSNPSPDQLKSNYNNDDEVSGYEKVPEEDYASTPGKLDSFEEEMAAAYVNLSGKKAQTRSTSIAPRGEATPKSIGGTDELSDGVDVTYAHTIKKTPSTASSASTPSYIEPLEARPVSGVMFIHNDGEPAWITVKDAKGRDVRFSANLTEQGSHF